MEEVPDRPAPRSPFNTGSMSITTAGATQSLCGHDLPVEKTIVIVRHGLTTWNEESRIQARSLLCPQVLRYQMCYCYHIWLRELLMTLISPRMARSRLSACVMLCPERILIGKTEHASGPCGKTLLLTWRFTPAWSLHDFPLSVFDFSSKKKQFRCKHSCWDGSIHVFSAAHHLLCCSCGRLCFFQQTFSQQFQHAKSTIRSLSHKSVNSEHLAAVCSAAL